MNTISRSRARGVRVRLGVAATLIGLLALAGAAAHPVSASPASFITFTTSSPQAPPSAASRSDATQTPPLATYVFYSVQLVSQSAWTHVVLSDTVPTVTGGTAPTDAKVVFVDHPDICTTATPPAPAGGFTCNVSKLAPNTPQTFDIVVQTPTSGTNLAVHPAVTGDESCNDQCNASHQEVFRLGTPPSWTLTSFADAPDTLTSYTNPNQTTPLSTDKHLCGASTCAVKNPQWTETDVPSGPAPSGILVNMSERPFTTTECASLLAATGLKCFGQVSQISAPSPGATNVFTCDPEVFYPTTCPNSLTFTVEVAAASLKSKVNLSKAVIFHDTGSGFVKVPRCNAAAPIGPIGSSVDCVVNVVQLANHDIQWTVRGPDNGNWGGAAG